MKNHSFNHRNKALCAAACLVIFVAVLTAGALLSPVLSTDQAKAGFLSSAIAKSISQTDITAGMEVYAAAAIKTESDTDKAAADSKTIAKPKLVSVVSKKARKAVVTWKGSEDVDGYQVWYKKIEPKNDNEGTDKKGASKSAAAAQKVTVMPGTATKTTLTGLVGGGKYRVKVRSFVKKDGKKSYSDWSKAKTVTITHTKWSDVQDKYIDNKKVKQLIFVKCTGGSEAKLILYTKKKNDGKYAWKKVLSCNAYIGQNGLGKKKEGDRKTPVGIYTITHAFGVLDDPGSKMEYIKLTDSLYWCGDKEYYNQLVDVKKHPHNCRGEHLITYTKQYAYSMALNYNKKCTPGKGSAIFLHCYGYYPYTLGCIAVSQDNMKTILKTCRDHTKIAIYKK